MPRFDNILICDDFNMHVCCSSDQFANNFKSLLESLDFTQSVSCPTYPLGLTLDGIISCLSVSICEVVDFPMSDHSLIRFDISAVAPAPQTTAPQHHRIFTPSTINDFAAAWNFVTLLFHTDIATVSGPFPLVFPHHMLPDSGPLPLLK